MPLSNLWLRLYHTMVSSLLDLAEQLRFGLIVKVGRRCRLYIEIINILFDVVKFHLLTQSVFVRALFGGVFVLRAFGLYFFISLVNFLDFFFKLLFDSGWASKYFFDFSRIHVDSVHLDRFVPLLEHWIYWLLTRLIIFNEQTQLKTSLVFRSNSFELHQLTLEYLFILLLFFYYLLLLSDPLLSLLHILHDSLVVKLQKFELLLAFLLDLGGIYLLINFINVLVYFRNLCLN